ncbi:Lead, cadmium, zinc and mercury transporting ATPase; Copper-translocating P-type ATPase [Leucobacter sp. 7(1)]|nr:Lead, cadmium, zinc and mercury transporting ATPase; Copper-translocating P-type ATPase [Leucobacter sp. 7(1)]
MSVECCAGETSARVPGGELAEPQLPRSWWRNPGIRLPLASGLACVTGLGLEILGGPAQELAAQITFALGLVFGAVTFVPAALRALFRRGRVGIGLLMTISAVGAVLLGYLGEAAALAFLYSLAEALEDAAMDRARGGLRALLSLVPETATVLRGGSRTVIPARELGAGDLLLVRPGERIATDGIIRAGRSVLDTSAITGESLPVVGEPGFAVSAGTIAGTGALEVEATADGTDNSLTTIVALVERAQAEKGERARIADRIARPLVPGVMILAALVALLGSLIGEPETWITRALVVLVAASPCALAIAVPVTVVSAIGAASRLGIVVKSGAAFERLGGIRRVAIDKTGTLTRNQPEVTEVVVAAGESRAEVLALASAVERHSTHPLAAAITAAGGSDRAAVAGDVTELAGSGIQAMIDGELVAVGSPRWVDPGPLAGEATRLEDAGHSCVVVARGGRPVGVIGVRDELRVEAAEAVAMLRDRGIAVAMLTGDNARAAHALAAAAGVPEVHAELRPEQKAAWVVQSSSRAATAMIGDGINDAPALAAASVGIAMGATGSDAAIESADVAFTGHDLRLIPQALAHARRGRTIMTQNVALSIAIIVVLVPLAVTGALGLAAVVLVHELAEMLVIGNGLRAARVPRRDRRV